MPHYSRAPLLEAVIDLSFAELLSLKQLEKIRDRFKRSYPTVQDRMNIEVNVQVGKNANSVVTPVGFQMNAENGSDALLVQTNSFTTVRLAPYEKWEILFERAKENLDLVIKVVGRQKLGRAAVRYINRFDIPDAEILGKPLEEYFLLGPKLPDDMISQISDFSMSATVLEAETGMQAEIKCGSVPDALIAHKSFILDIDVRTTRELPLRLEELWSSIETLRLAKNNIFEASITDKMRELIK